MALAFFENVEALAAAMGQLLDDMRKDGTCVSLTSKAQARIAYEPFAEAVEKNALMHLEEAQRILRNLEEPDGARTPPGCWPPRLVNRES